MVTVNSANRCPFCTGLHGQLARMAGLENPAGLEASNSADEARKHVDQPEISYARIFAEQSGRGDVEAEAFADLAEQVGETRAENTRALCWFLRAND